MKIGYVQAVDARTIIWCVCVHVALCCVKLYCVLLCCVHLWCNVDVLWVFWCVLPGSCWIIYNDNFVLKNLSELIGAKVTLGVTLVKGHSKHIWDSELPTRYSQLQCLIYINLQN